MNIEKQGMFHNYIYKSEDPSNKHTFEIHDVDISFINGIRRIILTDIPTCGMVGEIEPTIEIIKNTGPLHNEIMSNRIGLVPVCLTEDEIENYEDGSIELELNVSNENITRLNVHSGNIKGKMNGKDLTKIQLERIFPKHPVSDSHVLITRLRPGEDLHFQAKVVKKTARFHSAFCPVSLSNLFYVQDPTVSDTKEGVLDKERSYYKNKYGDARIVQFEIEPINNELGPKYLVNKAIEIIISKLKSIIQDILIDNQTTKVKVYQFEELVNTYEFNIQEEDDTIGNIIQSYVHNKYIRETAKRNINCSFIGYICPHPLKEELLVRITLDDKTDKSEFVKFMSTECQEIIEYLSEMKRKWNEFI